MSGNQTLQGLDQNISIQVVGIEPTLVPRLLIMICLKKCIFEIEYRQTVSSK